MAMAIVANALALYPSSQHRKCSLHAAEPIVREQPPPSWFLPETSDWPPGAVVRPNHLWRHVVEQVPCHYASPHTLDGIYWNLSPSTKIIFCECQSWFLPEVFSWPPGAVVRPDHLWSGVMASLSLLKCSSSYFGVDMWFTHSGLCFKKSVMIVNWSDMIHAQEEESPQNLSNKWFILFFSFSEYICVLSICFLLLKTKPIYLSPISIAQDTATYPVAWQNNS